MIDWQNWDQSISAALASLENCPAVLTQAQYDAAIEQLPEAYRMLSLKGDLEADKDLNKDSVIGMFHILPFVQLGEFYVTSCQWTVRPHSGRFLLVTVMKNGQRVELSTRDDIFGVGLSERKGPTQYKRYFLKEFSLSDREHVLEFVNVALSNLEGADAK